MQKFLSAGESYFNDHFGFRNRLIRWFKKWKITLFNDGSVYNIITGRNGWLFTSDAQMVEHYLGLLTFSPQRLRTWQALLESRRDWLEAQGIKYLFVIPPDKHTIYPEELPAWLSNATRASRESKLDQFLKHMEANSSVAILDLRVPLMKAKETAPTYLQNDTHWNLFGGFVACQELIRIVGQQFPQVPPLRLQDFNWNNIPAPGGDLARMLGSNTIDKNIFQFTVNPDLPRPSLSDAPKFISAWNPHKLSRILENSLGGKGRAVIFHDSFGSAWQRFLGYSFEKVVFMSDPREFNTSVILENKPDIVISEMLERIFDTQSPEELMVKQPLP